MITITNGINTLQVTEGAFKALFEPEGWRKDKADKKVDEEEKTAESNDLPPLKPEDLVDDEEDDEEDDDEEGEEVETPISEMTVNELKAYAEEHDIDISEAHNKTQLRHIIEEAMED